MRFCRFPLLAAVALLASCTVYVPMQPTVSTITQAGQLELTGSAQLSGRAAGTAVYSPLAHVLLAGGGTYWMLGTHWLLTGEGGYGYARSERVWRGLLGISPELRAQYSKVFGQVGLGLSTQAEMVGWGCLPVFSAAFR